MIIAILAAMTAITGLVVMLKQIGVSREYLIMAALIAGLLLGLCIGSCFGATSNLDDPRAGAHASGYHATSSYYATPQTTTVYGWSAISAAWGSMWRWGMAELGF